MAIKSRTNLVNQLSTGGSSSKVEPRLLLDLLDSIGFIAQPGYVVGKWYPFAAFQAISGTALSQNLITLIPFFVQRDTTISDLGARVSSLAASSNFQLAIYDADFTTKLPTTLIVATPNISSAATGPISGTLTTPAVLSAHRLYYYAVNLSSASAGLSGVTQTTSILSYYIGTATLANLLQSTTTVGPSSFTFAQAFGTWPDLTSQTLTETQGVSPLVVFKVSQVNNGI